MGAPNRLTVNYIENPVGFDASSVVLSWWSGDVRVDAAQSAYQVQCATSADLLDQEPDLWDSDRVASHKRLSVPYLGALPEAGFPAYWRVRSFDADGDAVAVTRVETAVRRAGDGDALTLINTVRLFRKTLLVARS